MTAGLPLVLFFPLVPLVHLLRRVVPSRVTGWGANRLIRTTRPNRFTCVTRSTRTNCSTRTTRLTRPSRPTRTTRLTRSTRSTQGTRLTRATRSTQARVPSARVALEE